MRCRRLDYEVVYEDMPPKIKAFTVCADDKYIIVLNSTLSYEQNRISFYHEIDHIKNGDFDKEIDADFLELCSHC